MKHARLAIVVFGLLILMQCNLHSQDHGFGAGIIIGEPTGISLKGWLSSTTAIDAGIAWSLVHETSFHIHADYLIHAFSVFETKEKIPLYYGIGGRIKTANHGDARLGVRMVVGVGYMFHNAPVDLFLEMAPILDLAPATELQLNAGFGSRFWFK